MDERFAPADLNPSQFAAANFGGGHALVLAGAGCGKTKTIVARCEHLIATGTLGSRIYVMTFTRKSAAEIVARVQAKLGNSAKELNASTFHTFCMALIRRYPKAFGCQGFTVIDRDDQVEVIRAFRGKTKGDGLPPAGTITDIYSFARNTRSTLSAAIANEDEQLLSYKDKIAQILHGYEERKRQRKYLDYDDILDVVATQLRSNPQIRLAICSRYSHVLIDEFQDTNPLQWDLLESFRHHATLFCVGDDAQSIYGFRGADFKNVHSFTARVSGATVLKLEENYRSTQEILDISNWLLDQSPLGYEKRLIAVRGAGKKPRLLNFSTEWEEAAWVANDIATRLAEGTMLVEHMVLVRSSFAGRAIEACLIERSIPYRFFGGTKLLQSAHIKDALSVMRVVANVQDEIAWIRYLRLWPGIGEITANRIIDQILDKATLSEVLDVLSADAKAAGPCRNTLDLVTNEANNPAAAFRVAAKLMESTLAARYVTDWQRRRRDFLLVEKLAEKHQSILAFIEQYMLDPVHGSLVDASAGDDAVTLSTVHSAKGTESNICYVVNVSPGAFPSSKSMKNEDEKEEERRVLYVALTRAKNELIICRRGFVTSEYSNSTVDGDVDIAGAYFFNELPSDLVDEEIVLPRGGQEAEVISLPIAAGGMPAVGINFD